MLRRKDDRRINPAHRRFYVYDAFRSDVDDGAMKKILVVTLAVVLSVVAFAKTSSKPKLTRAKAEAIALARAKGTVESAELEKEKGALVWSFDIRTSPTDITEVLVNANTGAIVDVQHETPAKEKAEKAQEKKEHKH
jgi:uncharacterized membrane protein YkoI